MRKTWISPTEELSCCGRLRPACRASRRSVNRRRWHEDRCRETSSPRAGRLERMVTRSGGGAGMAIRLPLDQVPAKERDHGGIELLVEGYAVETLGVDADLRQGLRGLGRTRDDEGKVSRVGHHSIVRLRRQVFVGSASLSSGSTPSPPRSDAQSWIGTFTSASPSRVKARPNSRSARTAAKNRGSAAGREPNFPFPISAHIPSMNPSEQSGAIPRMSSRPPTPGPYRRLAKSRRSRCVHGRASLPQATGRA